MSNQRRRSPKLCYLCGEPGADTKDHVPPRGMFPKQPKGNLITVPAHGACNQAFSEDDERFRNYIVAMGSFSSTGLEAWRSQVLPSLHRNKKLLLELREGLSRIRVDGASGEEEIVLPAIQVDGALIRRQVVRITRELFYKRFRSPLPKGWPIEVYRESSQDIVALLGRLRWDEVVPGVFCYCHEVLDTHQRLGVVAMVFFDSLLFWVIYGPQPTSSHPAAGDAEGAI